MTDELANPTPPETSQEKHRRAIRQLRIDRGDPSWAPITQPLSEEESALCIGSVVGPQAHENGLLSFCLQLLKGAAMTLEHRVEQLERKLARTRSLLCIAAVSALALACIAQKKIAAPEVIEAQSFLLVDAQGKTKGALRFNKFNTPYLDLSDDDGNGVTIAGGNKLTGVFFQRDGQPRGELMADPEGVSMNLRDKKGALRAAARVSDAGAAGFSLKDPKGNMVGSFVHADELTSLNIHESDGTVRASLGSGVTTRPDGTKTIHPESTLMFFGPDGKGLYKIP